MLVKHVFLSTISFVLLTGSLTADIKRSSEQSESIFRGTYSGHPRIVNPEGNYKSSCVAVFNDVVTIAGKKYFNVSANNFIENFETGEPTYRNAYLNQLNSQWMVKGYGSLLYVPVNSGSIYGKNVITLNDSDEPISMEFKYPFMGGYFRNFSCVFEKAEKEGYVKRDLEEVALSYLQLLDLPDEKFEFNEGRTELSDRTILSGRLRKLFGEGPSCQASLVRSEDSLSIAIRSDIEPQVYFETLKLDHQSSKRLRGRKLTAYIDREGAVQSISYKDHYGDQRSCLVEGHLAGN